MRAFIVNRPSWQPNTYYSQPAYVLRVVLLIFLEMKTIPSKYTSFSLSEPSMDVVLKKGISECAWYMISIRAQPNRKVVNCIRFGQSARQIN